jgi:hypothetical protein
MFQVCIYLTFKIEKKTSFYDKNDGIFVYINLNFTFYSSFSTCETSISIMGKRKTNKSFNVSS